MINWIFLIVKKLAGTASGTASWCTNVGNEFGQVLMSVLTDSEGDGLDNMAEGLMSRYKRANIPPPRVMYVDRDCCSTNIRRQFGRFGNMLIKLDVWHFMRRMAVTCCSESHALYGTVHVPAVRLHIRMGPRRHTTAVGTNKNDICHASKIHMGCNFTPALVMLWRGMYNYRYTHVLGESFHLHIVRFIAAVSNQLMYLSD